LGESAFGPIYVRQPIGASAVGKPSVASDVIDYFTMV